MTENDRERLKGGAGIGGLILGLLVLALAGPAMTQVASPTPSPSPSPSPDLRCPEGAVNVVRPNYLDGNTPPEECEYVLTWETTNQQYPGGWEPAGELQQVWTITRAHRLMYLSGQCGVIGYGAGGWESPGRFYPGGMVRATAMRQPPCTP